MLQFDEKSRARLERAVTSIVSPPSLSLDEAMGLLRRRGKLIAMVTGVVIAATIAFSLLAPQRYKSTAQILIDPRDLQVVKNELKPSTSSTDVGITVVETEARVISSETVLKRAVKNLSLDTDAEFIGSGIGLRDLFNAMVSTVGLGSTTPDSVNTPLLRALRTLQKRLYIERPERTYVVEVTAETEDAVKSARVAEGVSQAYLDEQAKARTDAARQATASLSGRLDELRERVRQAEDKVQSYNAEHNIVGASGELVNEQQLSQINAQLVAARAAVAAQKSRYEQIVNAQGDPGAMPEAVKSDTLRALRDRYAVAAEKQAELSAQLMPQHPFVVTARQEEEKVQRLIDEEIARLASAAKLDYQRVTATEASLEESLQAQKHQALDTNEALVKQRELEREAHASRAVYETALMRARETRELEQINPTNARIITHATPPNAKSWPPRLLLLLPLALVLGLALGTGLAVLKDRGAFRRTTRERVTEKLGWYA